MLVSLALASCAGSAREPRAPSRLAYPRVPRDAHPRLAFGVRDVRPDDFWGARLVERGFEGPASGVTYSSAESERFVFLAGAAYCDAGLETWTCPYCNGTNVVDVRVTLGSKNVRGYVGWDVDRRTAVVAFRGTEPNSIENWLENLDAHHAAWYLPPEPNEDIPPPPLRVHAGFLDSWTKLREATFAALADVERHRFRKGEKKREAPLPVVVTGHSLGGALATLAAFELAVSGYYDPNDRDVRATGATRGASVSDVRRSNEAGESAGGPKSPPPPPPRRAPASVTGVRTFGSPRVGDILFAAAYAAVLGDRTWRVTHAHDVVTSVPVRLMGFHHVPTEVFYPGADAKTDGDDAAQPVLCDGGGEDLKCSDGEWTHTSILDHLYYLDKYICGCNS